MIKTKYIYKRLVIIVVSLILMTNVIEAAFQEEIIRGEVRNISGNDLYVDGAKISLPSKIIKNVRKGDDIVFGTPEPILLVYVGDKLRYGYGNIFHFSNKVDLANGATLEILRTKKMLRIKSGLQPMVDVETSFRVSKEGETKEFSLKPGEYTTVLGIVIGVHRAEEPGGPIEGPQHWYVYEVSTPDSGLSNMTNLRGVDISRKDEYILPVVSIVLIILILVFIKRRVHK